MSDAKINFKTRSCPPHFDGCDPTIAEALKNSREIYCFVYDNPEDRQTAKKAWVGDYSRIQTWPYSTFHEDGMHENSYKFAEPIPISSEVKSVIEIVKLLHASGYELESRGFVALGRLSFQFEMFDSCGKAPNTDYIWEPEWLVEVECPSIGE